MDVEVAVMHRAKSETLKSKRKTMSSSVTRPGITALISAKYVSLCKHGVAM